MLLQLMTNASAWKKNVVMIMGQRCQWVTANCSQCTTDLFSSLSMLFAVTLCCPMSPETTRTLCAVSPEWVDCVVASSTSGQQVSTLRHIRQLLPCRELRYSHFWMFVIVCYSLFICLWSLFLQLIVTFAEWCPSMLWPCWLDVRKSIRPVKIEWWGVCVVVSLEQGADCLHMVQLLPLPSQNLIVSCLM